MSVRPPPSGARCRAASATATSRGETSRMPASGRRASATAAAPSTRIAAITPSTGSRPAPTRSSAPHASARKPPGLPVRRKSAAQRSFSASVLAGRTTSRYTAPPHAATQAPAASAGRQARCTSASGTTVTNAAATVGAVSADTASASTARAASASHRRRSRVPWTTHHATASSATVSAASSVYGLTRVEYVTCIGATTMIPAAPKAAHAGNRAHRAARYSSAGVRAPTANGRACAATVEKPAAPKTPRNRAVKPGAVMPATTTWWKPCAFHTSAGAASSSQRLLGPRSGARTTAATATSSTGAARIRAHRAARPPTPAKIAGRRAQPASRRAPATRPRPPVA